MGNIDWTMPAVKIERLIRGLSPWPSAYTFLEGKTLKIWAARVVQEETTARPGEIFTLIKEEFTLLPVRESCVWTKFSRRKEKNGCGRLFEGM